MRQAKTRSTHHHRDPSSRSGGFSLLEVMIALAISSIALVALLSLGNRSIGVHDRLQHTTQATLLAQHKMAETEAQFASTSFSSDTSEGFFEKPFDQYRWRIEFSETPLATVKQVSVTVIWGNEENNESVSIDSFLF